VPSPRAIELAQKDLPGVVVGYRFGDREVRAQVCYSDYPDEPLLGAPHVDLVLKMKYSRLHTDLYEGHSVPVFPGGFLGGPQRGEALAEGRRWYQKNLQGLREIGDGIAASSPRPYQKQLVVNGCLDGGKARGGFGVLGPLESGELGRIPFRDHMQNVAGAEFCLNICGNGNLIDRKVVDYCGIGAAIVSTRGLLDWEGPHGERFRDTRNVWILNSHEDLGDLLQGGMDPVIRDRLVQGSRRMYDRCFAPEALAAWWQRCAREVACA